MVTNKLHRTFWSVEIHSCIVECTLEIGRSHSWVKYEGQKHSNDILRRTILRGGHFGGKGGGDVLTAIPSS